MEVHHHGHIHMKSKWLEYLFQFFMLFLAVFLGFLAENSREHRVEDRREKEYIHSLIADLKADTATINNNNHLFADQYTNIDSLQDAFFGVLKNENGAVNSCYYFSDYIKLVYSISFTEKTITQLLSSGNMRLIRSGSAADSVMDYYTYIKSSVDIQKQMYVDHINRCIQSMYNVYDIYYLRNRIGKNSIKLDHSDWSQVKLLTTDPVEIKKLIALMESTKITIVNYRNMLMEVEEKAETLLDFLHRQYHIKEK